jgi:hypothetical protein
MNYQQMISPRRLWEVRAYIDADQIAQLPRTYPLGLGRLAELSGM